MDYNFEQFYYIRDNKICSTGKPESKPFACICLRGYHDFGESGWKFARGVAICSPKDRFTKAVGRKKASAVLEDKTEKIARAFSPELLDSLVRIGEADNGVKLILPNSNPKIASRGMLTFVCNSHYKKAAFGLSRKDLSRFEKDLVKHLP